MYISASFAGITGNMVVAFRRLPVTSFFIVGVELYLAMLSIS
jgi:hypothetical protein